MPYSGRPAQPRRDLVAALAGGAEEPVLLDREDALLEPDEVRLERRHVGEEERDPLRPAVRDVAQVERRDVERVSHRRLAAAAAGRRAGSAGASEIGIVNAKVAPLPSSDSHANRAPVALDDVARDGEAQARAAAGGPRPVRLVEALEDPRLVAGRDARAVVGDPALEHRAPAPAPHRRPAPPCRTG